MAVLLCGTQHSEQQHGVYASHCLSRFIDIEVPDNNKFEYPDLQGKLESPYSLYYFSVNADLETWCQRKAKVSGALLECSKGSLRYLPLPDVPIFKINFPDTRNALESYQVLTLLSMLKIHQFYWLKQMYRFGSNPRVLKLIEQMLFAASFAIYLEP
nr:unnamed protein product [Callosobruchus chinensis]